MAEPIFINDLIQKVNKGQIRIPSFQRGFIWDADRVAHLMDSIYKGFPFGSLLFWRTKSPLKTEKMLGPYALPKAEADYPLDYILDGQQRATSIFGVFQSTLQAEAGADDSAFKIYFDLESDVTVQDSNFIYVSDKDFISNRHFPLRLLFNPPEYRKYTRNLPEEKAEKIDVLYQRFTTARIPVQSFETDERAAVAIVFERINRMGVELDTLQLLSAWTWSEDFDLQSEFAELAEELSPHGFKDVGEDSDLLLRCCSAILNGSASPASIVELNGQEVRERFNEVKKGIFGAIDFLRQNLNVYNTSTLPYSNIIIPLSVFFATEKEQNTTPNDSQRICLESWIWKTFFTRRYSKRLEQLNDDIKYVKNLKEGSDNKLGKFDVEISKDLFLETRFSTNTVDTKTFILLLASLSPRSFISGNPVALENVLRDSNKKEFHHLFPKKYLTNLGIDNSKINAMVNFAIISRSDNNKISDKAPSEYLKLMPQNEISLMNIMESSACNDELFKDNFENFWNQRANDLLEIAKKLMRIG